jgi:hypothetical protein
MPGASTKKSGLVDQRGNPLKSPEKQYKYDITTKPLRQMDDDEAYEYTKSNFIYAYDQKNRDDFERNERYRNIYEALDPEDTRVDESTNLLEEDERLYSNTYMPVVAARIDTGACHCYNTIFAGAEYMRGEAEEDLDEIAVQAKIVPHMIATHRQIKLRYKVFRALLNALCFDYAVTMGRWQLEPGYIPKREEFIEPVELGGVTMYERRIEAEMEWVPDKIDRFNVENISYFQCAHDPDARVGFGDSEYFFDWRWEQFGKLKANEYSEDQPYGKYKNLDRVEKLIKDAQHTRINTTYDEQMQEMVRRQRVKVVRCFTQYHIAEAVVAGTEGEDGVIISRQNCFDWVTHLWRYHHRDNDFRGMGMAQRLERPQYDINAHVNSRRDGQNITNDPPKVVDQELVENQEGQIRVHSGKVFIRPKTVSAQRRSDDMLYIAKVGGSAQSNTMVELGLEMQAVGDMSGVSENTLSQYSVGRRSATQTAAVESHRASRFGTSVELLEEMSLEPIYQMQFLYNMLYMTREVKFKHYGEHGVYSVLVTPEDYKLTGGVVFHAMGSTTIRDEAVHTQQFMAAYDRVMMSPQDFKLREWKKEMARLMVPRDYHKLIERPDARRENIPPETENMIMAMGSSVSVSPRNDHQQHDQIHAGYQQTPDYRIWPEARKRMMDVHRAEHQEQMAQAAAQVGAARERSNALTETPGDNMKGIRPASLGVTP